MDGRTDQPTNRPTDATKRIQYSPPPHILWWGYKKYKRSIPVYSCSNKCNYLGHIQKTKTGNYKTTKPTPWHMTVQFYATHTHSDRTSLLWTTCGLPDWGSPRPGTCCPPTGRSCGHRNSPATPAVMMGGNVTEEGIRNTHKSQNI